MHNEIPTIAELRDFLRDQPTKKLEKYVAALNKLYYDYADFGVEFSMDSKGEYEKFLAEQPQKRISGYVNTLKALNTKYADIEKQMDHIFNGNSYNDIAGKTLFVGNIISEDYETEKIIREIIRDEFSKMSKKESLTK